MVHTDNRYNKLSDYLKDRFGCRVFKVTLLAGFTCPNRDGTKGTGGCIYCEPKTLVPRDYREGTGIIEQLEAGIEKVRKRHKAEKFIAYFQVNTNTYADTDRLSGLYKEAARHPDVAALAISTRPDCVADEVLDLLAELKREKHLWLELALQSAHDTTLGVIKRGHTSGDFSRAVERAAKKGIDVCAHIILGLPGEGKSDILDTIRFIARQGVWGVKFHQMQVVRGTPLEGMYDEGFLRPVGLEEYTSLVVDCLELLPPGVVVHRLVGDTPKGYLVAPKWGKNKFEVTGMIEGLLRARGTRQGAQFINDNGGSHG
jgi:radical SAM protein (TIGR01212 family)